MELDKAVQNRRSSRGFNNKKPNWRDIIECIDAARYAPAAGKNYTLKFILVDDQEKIRKIAEASQQDFIAEAKYVVVACSNPSRLLNEFGEQGKVWVRQQAGAAIENFLLKIVEKKLYTCWIGYFVEEQIKETLNIPEEIIVEGVFPIGYEYPLQKKKKQKIELDRILYFNKYNHKRMD